MSARIWFLVITAFWVVMNVSLWRAEFGRGRETVSDVRPELVVDRILNAPDASTLQVLHHGAVIGTLRWIPSVAEVNPSASDTESLPEGMIVNAGYNLDLDLSLNGDEPSERWRVLSHVDLNTNKVWQEFTVRVLQRPASWELVARQGSDDIVLRFEEGTERWEKHFSARDLSNPASMLGPYAMFLPGGLSRQLTQFTPKAAEKGFQWRARNDWLRVGRTRVRVYRLSATLFGSYEMVVYLSRAGEILKVTLPDTFVLVNEALPSLRRD